MTDDRDGGTQNPCNHNPESPVPGRGGENPLAVALPGQAETMTRLALAFGLLTVAAGFELWRMLREIGAAFECREV